MSDKDRLTPDDFFFSSQKDKMEKVPDNLTLDHLEQEFIIKTLKKHNKNISKAAKELGLSRSALYRRMDKYNITLWKDILKNLRSGFLPRYY